MKKIVNIVLGVSFLFLVGCETKTEHEVTKKEVTKEVVKEIKKEVTSTKASSKYNVTILTMDNKDKKITPKSIAAVFKEAGFFINDNRDMRLPFKRNFKKVDFDVYNLFTLFRKPDVLKLAKKYPRIGLFTPMSMSIYTRKGEDTISVSSLGKEAMAKIMEIPVDDPDFVAYTKLVQDTLRRALPEAKVEEVPYEMTKPTGPLVYSTHFEMEADADWEEIKDDFEMEFEGELTPNDFIMAGFNDLNYDFDEAGYDGYTFYDVYSICNISVIYIVSQKHPEAGAFAPCSLYMYNQKGSNRVEIGFPSVYNWIASLAIEDKPSVDVLTTAQIKMEKLLEKLIKAQ